MLDLFFKLGVAAIGIYLIINLIPFAIILIGVVLEIIGTIIDYIFGGR